MSQEPNSESDRLAIISAEDLPALYRASDRLATRAQRSYLRLARVNLALIVAGAFCTSWAALSPELRAYLAIGGATALTAGLSATAFLRFAEHDKDWFNARAIAESVKTISWKYMTGAEPYPEAISGQDADMRACDDLRSVLAGRTLSGGVLGGLDASTEQITAKMRQVRALDLKIRKQIYVRDRIRDQRTWYAKRAEHNLHSTRRWFALVAAAQLLGALAAIALVRWPEFEFNAAAVLSSVAAACLAWLQLKQHQELSHSYGMAAQELGFIEARAPYVQSESDFSEFVSDAENAISREHTTWIARREFVK